MKAMENRIKALKTVPITIDGQRIDNAMIPFASAPLYIPMRYPRYAKDDTMATINRSRRM